MSFTTLKTDIADWLDRDDLTDSQIETLIAHAEARFNRVIRHWRMITEDTLDLSSGRTVAQPSDFLEAKRLWVDSYNPLQYIEPRAFYERFPDSTTETARYFTIEGSNFVFSGTGQDVELSYYASLPALSDSQATNWLETNYPDIYLAGCLIAAHGLIGDDDRMAIWMQIMDRGLAELANETRDHDFNSAPVMMGGSRP